MRKILIALLIIVALSILWLWRGRDGSTLVDEFKTIQTSSRPIEAISYEGNGTGGTLHVGDIELTLDDTLFSGQKPHVGTTKDGQLALSFHEKVFAFGATLPQNEKLVANVPSGDTATISIAHGALAWPNFFEVNYMTGNSPKWKRYTYRKLTWHKQDGAKLEMLWRYEQYFYRNDGWVEALMSRPGATGVIRVKISAASR